MQETSERNRPEGNECGGCSLTRRNNFGGMKQVDMIAVLTDPKIREKWEEKRTYNATSGRKQNVKVDLSVFKTEEEFGEFYNEGDVVPVSDFLESEGHNPELIGDIHAQIDFATEETLSVAMGACCSGLSDLNNMFS